MSSVLDPAALPLQRGATIDTELAEVAHAATLVRDAVAAFGDGVRSLSPEALASSCGAGSPSLRAVVLAAICTVGRVAQHGPPATRDPRSFVLARGGGAVLADRLDLEHARLQLRVLESVVASRTTLRAEALLGLLTSIERMRRSLVAVDATDEASTPAPRTGRMATAMPALR